MHASYLCLPVNDAHRSGADGNETGIVNENGTAVTKGYDEADRLGSVTNKSSSGTTLSSFTYAYNADSLRSGVTEADGSVVTYGYDGLLHLSSEVRTGSSPYSASYTVDGADKRDSGRGDHVLHLRRRCRVVVHGRRLRQLLRL
jgi:YD repeat-containing protein